MKTYTLAEAAGLLGLRIRPCRLRLHLLALAEERGEALELIRFGGATAPWRIAQTDLRRLCPALDVEPTEFEQLVAQVRRLERVTTWLRARIVGPEESDSGSGRKKTESRRVARGG